MVSVYISNEMVQAAYGEYRDSVTAVEKVVSVPLPEGSVLNGTILRYEDVLMSLKLLANDIDEPINKVRLVINGAVTRYITMPDVRQPAYRQLLLEQEFSDSHPEALFEGMTLGFCDDGRAEVLACMVEYDLAESYADLLSDAGFGIASIEPAECAAIRLVSYCEMLCDSSFILSVLDGNTAEQFVFIDGRYRHSCRSRLYSERGGKEFSEEIKRSVEDLLIHFRNEEEISEPVNLLLCGYNDEELYFLRGAFPENSLRVAHVPDQDEMALPYSDKLSECLYAIGGLCPAEKGDPDFLSALQRYDSQRSRPDSFTLKRNALIASAAIMVLAFIAGITALNIHRDSLSEQLEALKAPTDSVVYDHDSIAEVNELLHKLDDEISDALELCSADLYTGYRADIFTEINRICAGQIRLTEIRANDLSFMLGFSAADAEDIPVFVQQLRESELFSGIVYSGYSKDHNAYAFTLECIPEDSMEGSDDE